MNEINGWTMRDEFAKAALSGIAYNDSTENMTCQQIAAESYDFADAMLEARKPKELSDAAALADQADMMLGKKP